MSSEMIVGKRYARAIFALAQEKNAVDQVGAELNQVTELLTNNGELAQLVENPAIGLEVKKSAFKQVLHGKVSDIVLNALLYVLDKHREKALPAIVKSYIQIANESTGRAQAIVYSPFPLSEADISAVSARFSKITQKTIQIENIVDPELLGGLKIRIGDTLYDGSLLSRLESMKKYLNAAKAM